MPTNAPIPSALQSPGLSTAFLARICLLALFLTFLALPVAFADDADDLTFFRKLYEDELYDVAVGQMETFLARNPRHGQRPELAWLLGYSCRALDRKEEASNWLAEFVAARPEDPRACEALFDAARCGSEAGLLDQCALQLEQLLREFESCAKREAALLLAARVRSALGEEAIAQQLLGYLIDSTSDQEILGRALFERARLRGERDIGAARADLEQLKASLPRHPLAGFAALELAGQAAASGRRDSALSDLEWVIDNFTQTELLLRAYRLKADVLDALARPAEAAAALATLRSRSPDPARDSALLSEECELLLRAGEHEQALIRARQYLDGAGEDPGAWSLLANALEARGESAQALEAWRRAAELAPMGETGLRAKRRIFALLLADSDEAKLSALGAAARGLLARLDDAAEKGAAMLSLGNRQNDFGESLAARRSWESVEEYCLACEAMPKALARLAAWYEEAGDLRGAELVYERLDRDYGASVSAIAARQRKWDLAEYFIRDESAALAGLFDLFSADADAERDLALGGIMMDELKDFARAWHHFSRLAAEAVDADLVARARISAGRAAYGRLRALELGSADPVELRRWRDRATSDLEAGLRLAVERGGGFPPEYVAAADYDLSMLRLSELPEGPDRLPLLDVFLSTWGDNPAARDLSARMRIARAEIYGTAGWSDEVGARRRSREDYGRALRDATGSDTLADKLSGARLALGRLDLADGDLASAQLQFEALQDASVGRFERSEALFGLGEIAEKEKRFRETQKHFRAYLEQSPGSPRRARCLIHIGDACYFLSEWAQAAEAYERVLLEEEDSPLLDAAVYRLSLSEEQLGRSESQLARLEWLLEHGTERFRREAAWRLASRAQDSEDETALRRHLEFLNSLGWQGRYAVEGGLVLGELYVECGEGDMALTHYDSLLELASLGDARPEAELGRLRALLLLDRRAEVDSIWRTMASDSGLGEEEQAGLLLDFGRAHLRAGETGRAAESFNSALGRFPASESAAWCLYELAMIEARARRYADALTAFDRLARQRPSNDAAREGLIKAAGILYSQGDYAGASERYESSLSLHETPPPELLYQSSLALEKNGQAGAALERIQALLARYPDDELVPEAMMKVGYYLQALGQYERAVIAYRNADLFQDREGKARLHFWLADCHEASGDGDEALAEFLRVSYLYADQGLWGVTASLRAAKLYERRLETRQARQIYERIVASQGVGNDFGKAASEGLERLAGQGKD